MATYCAMAKLFIGAQLIAPGEVFESDLPPGRNWKPVDDAARAACKARDKERGQMYAEQNKYEPPTRHALDAIVIPSDWLEKSAKDVITLARRLGAAANCNYAQAIAQIERTIASRNEQAAELKGAA